MTKRTIQERIQELEAKIAAIKARDERKKVRTRPEVKHLNMALRSIDKGLNASEDAVLRKALDEARATVSSCLALFGVTPKAARANAAPKRRAKPAAAAASPKADLDAAAVLTYIKNNSGMKGEVIAGEFGTDTASLRPVLKQLAADGAIKSEGKGRGPAHRGRGFGSGRGEPLGTIDRPRRRTWQPPSPTNLATSRTHS